MKFPYQQRHGRFLPIIPIKLKSVSGEWITFDAFVDSGASYSIFTAEIGEILGLDVEDGNKIYVTVGDGSLITVYLHELEVKIGEKLSRQLLDSRNSLESDLISLEEKMFLKDLKFVLTKKRKSWSLWNLVIRE